MPKLIVQQFGRTEVGKLAGPVLIGRVRACGVLIDSADVSRVHAWVGQDASGAFFVADTFSREGTHLNGAPIITRQRLQHGDQITVGPAKIVFHDDDTEDEPFNLDLSAKVWKGDEPDVPIRFLCCCGATIAVSTFFAGRSATCTYCSARLVIPRSSGQVAGQTIDKQPEQTHCSICQCAMMPGEVQTTCPGCGLSFHTDCWQENKGCSAYGCSQVNALDEAKMDSVAPTYDDQSGTEFKDVELPDSKKSVPWGYLALGAVAAVVVVAGTVGYLMYVR